MNVDHGMLGGFRSAHELVAAVDRARLAGAANWETFTPYEVDELIEKVAAPEGRSPVARAMAAGGLAGGGGAFFMMEFATHVYPIDVGGRPLDSWPAFIPITFELAVLTASLVGVFTFFVLAGFPRPHHPAFDAPEFRRASQDRFFLLIPIGAQPFDAPGAAELLRDAGAESVREVGP